MRGREAEVKTMTKGKVSAPPRRRPLEACLSDELEWEEGRGKIEGGGKEGGRAGANTDGGLLRRFLQHRRRATKRESKEGLVRGAESSIHMDLRRGEDEEMGWEREVGAAALWAAGDDVGRRREERDRRREGQRRREHRERERKRNEMEGRRNEFIYIF